MELKVKELCVLDWTEPLPFNDLFQNYYFKKHFPENKVKVHMFEVPVFVASLTEILLFFVSHYDQEIKEKSRSLLPEKKPEILCQNKTNLITLIVKKRISFLPVAIKFYISW